MHEQEFLTEEGLRKLETELEHLKNVRRAEVAKRLHKSHSTIKKLCSSGIIRTTKSGLIEESSIEEYLHGN